MSSSAPHRGIKCIYRPVSLTNHVNDLILDLNLQRRLRGGKRMADVVFDIDAIVNGLEEFS